MELLTDLLTDLSQFTFLELLFFASLGFLLIIFILSFLRYKFGHEKLALGFRHIAGFIVGLLDQMFMVIFNFQHEFLAIVVLFDYAAYCLWFLIMPNFTKHEKKKVRFAIWIIISAAFNTLFEHISLILIFGEIFYPTEPIVWTSIHTVIFYLVMHILGVLIMLYGFRLSER